MSRQSNIEYGKLKTDLSGIRDIRTYHDLFHEGPCCLDESEWNDLDMDDLFEFADRCITPVGEMLLYSKLHHMHVDSHADEKELTAERIDSDGKFRKDVEYALSELTGHKGDAVIRYLSALDGTYVLVSTHDIELARSFRETLDTYHFSEGMHDGKLVFNYRLTPGVEYTINAISILKNCGYPDEPSGTPNPTP